MSAYDLTLGTGQSAIRFDGGAGIVGARHGWGLQNLTDWMSLSDAKNDVNERALQHGALTPARPRANRRSSPRLSPTWAAPSRSSNRRYTRSTA